MATKNGGYGDYKAMWKTFMIISGDYIWTLNYVKHTCKEKQAVYQITVCVE